MEQEPKTFFEEKGEAFLKTIGMTKTDFANKMGIKKQNVKALFKSKNLRTIRRAAEVMGVPFELLIGYTTEPTLEDLRNVPEDEWSEGYHLGLEDGITQTKIDIAKAMLSEGLDASVISKCTSLSAEEIVALGV